MSSGSVDALDAVVGEEFKVLNEVYKFMNLYTTFKRCIGFKTENDLSLNIKFLWPSFHGEI